MFSFSSQIHQGHCLPCAQPDPGGGRDQGNKTQEEKEDDVENVQELRYGRIQLRKKLEP